MFSQLKHIVNIESSTKPIDCVIGVSDCQRKNKLTHYRDSVISQGAMLLY